MTELSAESRPRLRENILHIYPDMDRANLITPDQTFNLPTYAALAFLRMRSYCTGYHAISDIAGRSGCSITDVIACLESLRPAGIVHTSDDREAAEVPEDEARARLLKITDLWANELKLNYIGNELAGGRLNRDVLIGWLIEMYHYIKDFPEAIAHAARQARGDLEPLLWKFANEERGHEVFVLATLAQLGLSRAEIEASSPMLSTRMIGVVMREMFDLEPSSVLLLAALVEAQEFDEDQVELFKAALDTHYGIGAKSFDPYFEHQKIDFNLGHARMLEDNINLLRVKDRAVLDKIVNKLHEVKHAFDLQSMEIRQYYADLNGKYVPRQAMNFAAVQA